MGNDKLEKQAKEEKKEGEIIYLRSYSKLVYFFPLFFTNIILWILQYFLSDSGKPVPWLGFVWMLVFFINIITIGFDISSTKLFIIILIIVVVIVLAVFLILPSTLQVFYQKVGLVEFNIGMNEDFYMVMTFILGLILLITLIAPRFNYWKLERNELYHKKGIFVEADRYPTKGLRFKKKIPDVLEYFLLGAGSITFLLGKDDSEHLSTIPRINNKAERIDSLLSELEVEIEPNK
jgi:magnesium-transporting ATPase (P-type)